jgi:hypothetical protein
MAVSGGDSALRLAHLGSSTASTTAERLGIVPPRKNRSLLLAVGMGLAFLVAIATVMITARSHTPAAVPAAATPASHETASSAAPAPAAASTAQVTAAPIAEPAASAPASAGAASSQPPARGALAVSARRATTPAPAPKPAPSSAPDCTVPWTLDSAGIKRPRPECMR